ncbi:MAG: S8 family serine peptidase [Bryobacteraceae bacterium]
MKISSSAKLLWAAAVCLFLAGAPALAQATFSNQVVTTQAPPSTGCVRPTPATSFLTTDNTVYLYFEAIVTTSDTLTNNWLAPDGTVVAASNWNSSPGNFCFTGASLSISNLPASQLGSWQARVYDNGQLLFSVSFSVSTPAVSGPTISAGGVVDGASFKPGPVAPGSIVSIFGTVLASGTAQATTASLPTTLQSTQVLINGIAAPLFYVSPSQINAQVPWEVTGLFTTDLTVKVFSNDVPSNVVAAALATTAPGIFVITHDADSTLVTSARPAVPGEYLRIYCTGLGMVTNEPPTGAPGPFSPLAYTAQNSTVTIEGLSAYVPYSGLAPGFVGLYQVNVQVPANAVSASAAPLVLSNGGNSTTADIVVQSGGAQQFTLTAATAGSGSGSISASPPGPSYAAGTVVTLIATPNAGSTFAGWSGACSGTGNCTVTMNANQAVTAAFNLTVTVNPTLTITTSGTGSGTVSPSPAGTSCGSGCLSFAAGTVVALTAAPNTGSTFAGWSGACSGTGSCTVSMNSNQAVTAAFNLTVTVNPTLTITTSGTGSGTVSSSPTGTSCGSGCLSFAAGTTVTLTATPNTSSTFAGWSGACSGTGSCTVTMNSSQAVTATFDPTVDITPQLAGAFSFPGPYPLPGPVVYTNQAGQTITSHAHPGQIFLFVAPNQMDVSAATALVAAHNGSIIAQIPTSGLYWVRVTVGAEATFIAAVENNPAVIFVGPDVPATGSQAPAVDLSGATSLIPLIPNGLIAQFDNFQPVGHQVCGQSHGAAVNTLLEAGGLTATGYDISELQQGTNQVALDEGLNALAHSSDIGFGLARAAQGALDRGQKLVVNVSLQAGGQPNDGIDRSICETHPNDPQYPQCSAVWNSATSTWVQGAGYASWKTDEFSFLVGIAGALEFMPASLRDNTLVVVSSGNSGLDLTYETGLIQTLLPNAFPHMLIVGATGAGSQPYLGYNHSSNPAAMLYAPGPGVVIPQTGGCLANGTSFAAPQVANLAAQLAQRFPNLTTAQIVQAIMTAGPIVNGLPTLPTPGQVVAVIQSPPSTLPSPGTYSGACAAQVSATTCCDPETGFCATAPGVSTQGTFGFTLVPGTSLSQFTSQVCAIEDAALGAAGCVSFSCNVAAVTSTSATFAISCIPPPVPSCTGGTTTETCSATQQ